MKQTIWIVLGWMVLGTTAQAASFDCAKAQSKIEKMICFSKDKGELSKLDERLANHYNAILEQTSQQEELRISQNKWLSIRNQCVEYACVKSVYESRLQTLTQQYKDANQLHYTFCDRNNHSLYCLGQTGKGYEVCESYLKHLRVQPEPPTCEAPIPPGFKRPDWEEMDVMEHLDLAYQAEKILHWYTWYKHPDFETWRQIFLKEIHEGQIAPRMRKAKLALSDVGSATILAYTRDRDSCNKGYMSESRREASIEQRLASPGLLWSGAGDAHFIFPEDSPAFLQEIVWEGSHLQSDLLLYSDRPYFIHILKPYLPIYKGTATNDTFKSKLSEIDIFTFDPEVPAPNWNQYSVHDFCKFVSY